MEKLGACGIAGISNCGIVGSSGGEAGRLLPRPLTIPSVNEPERPNGFPTAQQVVQPLKKKNCQEIMVRVCL